MQSTEIDILQWMRQLVQEGQARRKWATLPPDFEAQAVAALFVRINKHFGKHDIKRRIAASKAQTFEDLLFCLVWGHRFS